MRGEQRGGCHTALLADLQANAWVAAEANPWMATDELVSDDALQGDSWVPRTQTIELTVNARGPLTTMTGPDYVRSLQKCFNDRFAILPPTPSSGWAATASAMKLTPSETPLRSVIYSAGGDDSSTFMAAVVYPVVCVFLLASLGCLQRMSRTGKRGLWRSSTVRDFRQQQRYYGDGVLWDMVHNSMCTDHPLLGICFCHANDPYRPLKRIVTLLTVVLFLLVLASAGASASCKLRSQCLCPPAPQTINNETTTAAIGTGYYDTEPDETCGPLHDSDRTCVPPCSDANAHVPFRDSDKLRCYPCLTTTLNYDEKSGSEDAKARYKASFESHDSVTTCVETASPAYDAMAIVTIVCTPVLDMGMYFLATPSTPAAQRWFPRFFFFVFACSFCICMPVSIILLHEVHSPSCNSYAVRVLLDARMWAWFLLLVPLPMTNPLYYVTYCSQRARFQKRRPVYEEELITNNCRSVHKADVAARTLDLDVLTPEGREAFKKKFHVFCTESLECEGIASAADVAQSDELMEGFIRFCSSTTDMEPPSVSPDSN
jgi:hypothetical protein